MATIHKLTIGSRVLVYRDYSDGDYIAHALEMDLIGFGDSPNKALTDLKNAMAAQISFAIQKKSVGAVHHMAPKSECDRWEKANRDAMADLASGDVSMSFECQARCIEFSAEELKRIMEQAAERPFSRKARPNACCHA